MQIAKFIPAGFLFLSFLACNPSENTSENTQPSTPEKEVQSEEPVAYTDAEKEAIVNKGGPKAGDQTALEELLTELESNVEKNKGTAFESMLGHWVGAFGKNKINITLTSINETDKTVSGYSVCAGNFRSLTGSYKLTGNVYAFSLNEPGDDPYDGTFDFTIEKNSSELRGTWTPFKEKGNTAKEYTLEKRDYKYDRELGQFKASSWLLEDEDVQNESLEDLTLMRNEIYARHGYCFKDKDMRYHFEQQDWYIPMGVDIRHELTDIEIANIALIYEYEDYYLEYTDDFGR